MNRTPLPNAPSSILLVKPGSLGDIIHALPCLVWLRAAYPTSRISWLIDTRWAPLLNDHPLLDQLLPFPRHRFRGPLGPLLFLLWLPTLRHLRPALAIDLQGLLRSALLSRAARPALLLGGSDAREGAPYFYDIVAPVSPAKHAVLRYRSILAPLQLPTPLPAQFPLPSGSPPARTIPSNYILLHPYSRGAAKSLTPRHVSLLAARLQPHPVVLVGHGPQPPAPPVNLLDLLHQTTLPELLWLARHATFAISVDSGPAHIASACGTPTLAIHTWSNPSRVGPPNPNSFVFKNRSIRMQAHYLQPSQPSTPYSHSPPIQDQDIHYIADFVIQFLENPARSATNTSP